MAPNQPPFGARLRGIPKAFGKTRAVLPPLGAPNAQPNADKRRAEIRERSIKAQKHKEQPFAKRHLKLRLPVFVNFFMSSLARKFRGQKSGKTPLFLKLGYFSRWIHVPHL
jgi:hypothetical protein